MFPKWRLGPWLGGAIVGGGIATMHYLGMAAFEIEGVVIWDPALVVVSILLGTLIGAAALPVRTAQAGRQMENRRRCAADPCDLQPSFHRDGRGFDHPRFQDQGFQAALPAAWLAVGVAIASFAIILLSPCGPDAGYSRTTAFAA